MKEKKTEPVFFCFFLIIAPQVHKGKRIDCAELHGLLVPAISHLPKRRDTSIPPLVIINRCDNFSAGRPSSVCNLFDSDSSEAIGLQLPTRRRSLNFLKGTCRGLDARKYDDDVSEQQAAFCHGPHQLARTQVLVAFLLILHFDFQCTLILLLILPTQQHHHQQQRRQQLGGDAQSLSPNPTGTYSA